jgi:hypothetical protein
MTQPWKQSGSSLTYSLIDQDYSGQIIAAASGGTIYATINGGNAWGTTTGLSGATIVGLSVGLNINYAYCCTSSAIYACANITGNNTWEWIDVTGNFPAASGKTYTSIIIGNRQLANGVYYVVLGTTQGIYNTTQTSTPSSIVSINDNSGTKNWSYVSMTKEFTGGTNYIIGISGGSIYLGSTNTTTAMSIGTDPNGITVTNIVYGDIFQINNSATSYKLYMTTSVSGDTLYNGVYNGTTLRNGIKNILPITGTQALSGITWTFISSVSTSVAATQSTGQIYTSTDGGVNFTARESNNSWNKVVTSPSGSFLVASTTQQNQIFISTNGGVSCMFEGTNILTPNGEVKIENLVKNDEVVTTEGIKKIKCIGSRSVNVIKNPEEVCVIKKDKYSNNIPNKDLYLTSCHALLFNNDEFDKYTNEKYDDEFYKCVVPRSIDNYKKLMMRDCNIAYSPNIEEYSDKLLDNHFKYYHIVLENDNEHQQYAIYTDGMLSETASESYFLKHSNLQVYL